MVNKVSINKESKKWYTSKTVWANALLVIAGVAAGGSELISSGTAITSMAIINLVLRVLTKNGVKFK